ncbi:Bacteriophage lambda, GpH, tail tape measure, C-terminal [uncultured Caudovirales phage]|uniref:Bacteriophage lambda, GpH, tail tape measure, C-terminal n=1 Tax=uncultured Caudovirales phage TaxID=2100421 RepID=A0A6J5LRB4_9CAUD|nr:Bacteriophage lambda, GpH, tail tape measure, C-terminal [uncultured Caudovirales phage]CAB4160612.1 Bacteriophage lambda, GpH, tail tape measure, C-terminal [uncultured Caudovirales phage]CAB4166057.1 Bacteriophage lambda, GpH, tail tape measure, C-terminal [uncultured Caudovirales phage]
MADLKYRVDVDTASAQRAISGLKSSIAGIGSVLASSFAIAGFTRLSAQLDDLRRTFQTLYKDTQIGGDAFDDVKKLASELGLEIGVLAESVVKLKAAGITPTVAQLRLFADVASVSTDKIGALQSITDLFTRTMGGGLGLEELERLQDRGIPVYDILIQKLGKSRLELSEFGKTAKGAEVIRAALQEGLNERFGGAAANRADSLSTAMTRLKNAFQEAVDVAGQSGLSQAISDIANYTSEWIKKNQELIKSFSVGLAGAFKFFLENISLITKAAALFFIVFAAKKVADLIVSFVQLSKVIGKSPIGLLAIGLAFAAQQMGVFDEIMNKVSDSFNKGSKEAEDYVKSVQNSTDATNNAAAAPGFKVLTQGDLGKGTRNFKSEIEALNEKLRIFRAEMDDTFKAYVRANEEQRKTIDLETALIGLTTEQVEIQRQQAEITKRTTDEVAKLREAKNKLTEIELKEGRAKIIDENIARIEKQAEKDKEATAAAIKNSEARKSQFALEQYQLQNRIGFEDQLLQLQKEMAQSGMTEIQKKYDDITRAADASALAAIRAEEARRGPGVRLSMEEQKAYYEEARRYNEVLIEQQKRLYDESRKFETGWSKAFREYADEATNAAKQAERIFQKTTQGMEDMIVNFAKTGKFEFRGFVNSILEELLRSQIRQLMTQIFNIGGSRGSGSSSILGSLLGFANGGIIPTNAPVLVGERGPELISGAAGRNVTPNSQLGLGTTNVVYNISAVDALSFKQMVAADPSFLYAVTEQGRRTLPTSRR